MNEQAAIDRIVNMHGYTTAKHAVGDFADDVMEAYAGNEAWAVEFVGQAVWARAQRLLKVNMQQSQQVAVLAAGALTLHSAAIGVKRRGPDDAAHYQQELIWTCTWDEIRQWRKLNTEHAESSNANAAMAAKLLLLEDRVPGARTPEQACLALGVTVIDYLAA